MRKDFNKFVTRKRQAIIIGLRNSTLNGGPPPSYARIAEFVQVPVTTVFRIATQAKKPVSRKVGNKPASSTARFTAPRQERSRAENKQIELLYIDK